MLYKIESRHGRELYATEAASLREVVELAVRPGIGIDLTSADLSGADLSGADLSGAYFPGAILSGANLSGTNFGGANLTDADLGAADLSNAKLTGTKLTGTKLNGVDLTGTDLAAADLRPIRDDVWAMLSAAPKEATGLRAAITTGRLVYRGGGGALLRTIANVRDAYVGTWLDSSRPAERFFMAIRPGDTPETSQVSSIVHQWVDEWLTAMLGAFGA
jgi:uncharacterized protein YjbI with pentapeptide repeats